MSNYQLKSLREHCFDLAYLFFSLKQISVGKYARQNYAYWLHLAAGVENISMDHERFYVDNTSSLDLTNTLYDRARQSNTQIFQSLVVFNLIWHVFLKLLADHFDNKDRCALNKACEYLDSVYNPFKNVVKYNDLVRELKRLIRSSGILDADSILKNRDYANRSSVGILLVDRINDFFAHIAYQFPLGSDPSGGHAIDPEIIDRSSRIVLLTVQMLLLPWFEEQNNISIKPFWNGQDAGRRISVHAFLRTVHLKLV